MTTPLDDGALDRLVIWGARVEPAYGESIGALVDELRAHRIQTSAEARLRSNHAALMGLVRSDALACGELDQALREISETATRVLHVERCSMWRLSEDHDSIACELMVRAGEDAHESGVELARADVPAYFEALLEGESIVAHRARTDPRTLELWDPYLKPRGVHALLDVPVRLDDRALGLLRAEHVGAPRNWSTLDQQFAGTLADFTTLAIQSHRRRETEEQLRQTVELIERQRLAIADLSAPIIDVWDGVLAVVLVGVVDTRQSIDLTERLLQRISASGTHTVILDLTGIDVVDTMTASHLLQMLRSARLLGARCVLGGISPGIAQTLVQLDVDLSELTLVRSLKEALEASLRRGGPRIPAHR